MTHLQRVVNVCFLAIGVCACVALPVVGRHISPASSAQSSLLVSSSSLSSQSSVYFADGGLLSDEYHDLEEAKVKVRRQAVMNKTRLWPSGIVPYVIDQAYTAEIRNTIENAMREIENSVGSMDQPCVRFVPRLAEINYLDVRLGNNCNSVIGLDYTGPQVSNFSRECAAAKGIMVHELLHTLGLYHEQDRYDRDDYLNINYTNLLEGAERDFILKNKSNIDTLGTPYDYTSIMQYGPYSFSKNQRVPVMTPKPELSHGVWMGQRYALSRLDVLRVQRLYRCEENTSHISSDISQDKRLAWCDFGDGICDFSVTTIYSTAEKDKEGDSGGQVNETVQARNILWAVTSKPTPDGPLAGATNGLDSFFYASKENADLVYIDKTKGQLSNLSERDLSANKSTETQRETSNATQTIVSLITPTITTKSDVSCIEFHIFQPGPTSYLNVYASGPLIPRQLFLDLQDIHTYHWATVRHTFQLPRGIQFQVDLTVVLDQGSVSIDDFHLLEGRCQ